MGVVSLGKMAEILEIKKQDAMALLNNAKHVLDGLIKDKRVIVKLIKDDKKLS